MAQDQIELRKVALRFRLRFVLRKRESANGLLRNSVGEGLREKELVFYQRSIEVQSRSIFGNANDLASLESQVREKIVQLYVPAIAAASRFNFRDAAYELTVLRRVRLLKDLHGFD